MLARQELLALEPLCLPFFVMDFFQTSQTICPGLSWNCILLTSASGVAGIILLASLYHLIKEGMRLDKLPNSFK
jgi:hypothetical protein